MANLGLNYDPAIHSTVQFEKKIKSLSRQLDELKAKMKMKDMQSAKADHAIFPSQFKNIKPQEILDQWGKPFKAVREEIQATAKPVGELKESLNETADTVGHAGGAFTASAAKVYAYIKAGKLATETIKDVETGMVSIARVMEDSSFVLEEYRDELFKLGVKYGQPIESVQNIALRWAQSDYNVADSLKLTETSLLALNAAELDAQNATESMIGIMAQWELQAEDLGLVMDKINKTADTHAATSQDLVDGLLRSSSAAKIMNMSLDETIATLVTMREASGRTGKEVGSALNSILSYIQRPASINVMEAMGIEVFVDEAKSQFRSALGIFGDISANWDNLSTDIQDGFIQAADDAELFNEELAIALGVQEQWNDLQKRDISQAAAGVYRRNYFIGLIERMTNVQEALNNMMDANGYSMEKNALTMETLERKQQSLETSAKALAAAMGDAGLGNALKLLADGGTKAIDIFNSLPKGAKDAIAAFTGVMLAVKALEAGTKLFGAHMPVANAGIKLLTGGIGNLTTNTMALATAMKTTFVTNLPLLGIAALTGGIVALTNHIIKQREEMERSLEVFQRQSETSNTINELLPQYEELASKTRLTAEEQSELLDIKQQITNLLPETKQALDNENLSLSTQLGIIRELNEEELEYAKNLARRNIAKHEGKYEDAKKEVEEATKSLKKWTAVYDELYAKRDELTNKEKNDFRIAQLMIEAQTKRLEKNKTTMETVKTSVDFYNESLRNQSTALEDTDKKINKINQTVFDSEKAYKTLGNIIKGVSGDFKTLNKAMQDVRNGQVLSAETVIDLIDKYDLSANAIKEVAGGYTIEMSALEDVREARIKTVLDGIEAEKDLARIVKNQAESKIRSYQLEISQLKDVADARRAATDKAREYALESIVGVDRVDRGRLYSAAYKKAKDEFMGLYDEWERVSKDLEKLEEKSNLYIKLLNKIGTSSGSTSKATSAAARQENELLKDSLRLLEHKKRMTEESQQTIKNELAELKRIDSEYVRTAEERMDMMERIYATEKRLRDKTLQDSVDWINRQKSLGQLSIEEEIAGWERVLKNQYDNLEARRQAEVNLYKLRNQIMDESYTREERHIQHITKLGILSTEEQIQSYKKLYETKAKSEQEEQARIENQFGLFKKLISDEQRTIKEAHDKRIEQIDDEANKKKAAQEEIIKGIDKEIEALNRREQAYDHDKRMEDLEEELAYWQVRTSEQARQKVIEIEKRISEEKHKREVDLEKQGLEDKKKIAQDEIKSIEETAKEEKKRWEKSYKEIEIVFDEHTVSMIALASTMSKDMFDEFKKNYLDKIATALDEGDFETAKKIVRDVPSYADKAKDKTYGSDNAQIYRLASSIVGFKREYEYGGDKSAEQRAVPVYDELTKLSPTVADMLHRSDYLTAKDYIETLPKFHTGAKTLSYGMAMYKPGELIFPPDLSKKLEGLIAVLNQRPVNQTSKTSTFNDRKTINNFNAPLYNSEKTTFEDDIDGEIFARQLHRVLKFSK